MHTSNPIMSMITFLASAVDTDLAAAAAQAALEKLTKDGKEKPDSASIKSAAAAALVGAGLKAKALKEKEERKIQTLVTEIVDLQLQKIELKMQQFEELEKLLKEEQLKVEKAKQQLYNEKMQFESKRNEQS